MTSMLTGSTRRATADKPLPRLKVRGPLVLGTVVAAVFFGVGLGAAGLVPIDNGVGMAGTIIVESKVKAVQHQTGGIVGRIHVVEGQTVAAGDVLVTLDTGRIEEQLTALKAQAVAAARQLDLIGQEAETIAELHDRKLASRSRLLALQRQVAEVEKENAALTAKIAMTGQELVRAEIRSPVAGRVLSIAVNGPDTVLAAGATVMEIVPQADRLVIEGRLAVNRIDSVKPGMPAKVWMSALSWRDQRPLKARLAWVSADSIEDRRSGVPYYLARVELDDRRSDISRHLSLRPGMRTEILLLTGERTLLDQLIDPLMRNVHRAFQS